jgi:hypothetical protein
MMKRKRYLTPFSLFLERFPGEPRRSFWNKTKIAIAIAAEKIGDCHYFLIRHEAWMPSDEEA